MHYIIQGNKTIIILQKFYIETLVYKYELFI